MRAYVKDGDLKILPDGEYMHKKGMLFGSAGQEDENGKFYADIRKDGDKIYGYKINEFGECLGEGIVLEGYSEVLKKGDNVLSVHIPSGEPFDIERCNLSFEKAKCIFKTYYPEYEYKCFTCYSWLMEKRLKEIMGKETNITKFADLFHSFPTCSDGFAHYSIFKMGKDVSISDYPEKTSMQKAVKKYLINGGYFYFKGGIMTDEN